MGAHAGFHLIVAGFSALLLFTTLRMLPPIPPGWIGRGPRTILLGGLIQLSGGQAVEAIGAMTSQATIHNIGVGVSAAGTSITPLGAALTLIVLIAVRFDRLGSPWVAVAFAVATLGGVAFGLSLRVLGAN